MKELWGLVKELLNWSCKDRLLDDWGQLVASFIHCYHGLAVVGEIEIAVIMVEVLVSKGPGVEDIAPYDLYDKGYELSSGYGQAGMHLVDGFGPWLGPSAVVELGPSNTGLRACCSGEFGREVIVNFRIRCVGPSG